MLQKDEPLLMSKAIMTMIFHLKISVEIRVRKNKFLPFPSFLWDKKT